MQSKPKTLEKPRRKKRARVVRELLHFDPPEDDYEIPLQRRIEGMAAFRGTSPAVAIARWQRDEEKKVAAVSAYKDWAPPLLQLWAVHVVRQFNLSADERRTHVLLKLLEAGQFDKSPESDDITSRLDYLTAHFGCPEDDADDELRQVLFVHHVSIDKAEVKAGFFGLRRRAYWNRVDEALKRFAASRFDFRSCTPGTPIFEAFRSALTAAKQYDNLASITVGVLRLVTQTPPRVGFRVYTRPKDDPDRQLRELRWRLSS